MDLAIDKKKPFRANLAAGCSKADLMRYYCIKSEEKWDRLVGTIKAA